MRATLPPSRPVVASLSSSCCRSLSLVLMDSSRRCRRHLTSRRCSSIKFTPTTKQQHKICQPTKLLTCVAFFFFYLSGCSPAGVLVHNSFQLIEPCCPCPTKSLLSLDLNQTASSGLQECRYAGTAERHDGIADCSWTDCGHLARDRRGPCQNL